MAAPISSGSSAREPKLLDRVREAARVRHLSLRTERTYVQWIRRYVLFHGKRHPSEMGEAEINAFLTHLAVDGNVSASTQTQALCAILFLYRAVLGREVGELEGLVRAKRRRRLPVVLTAEEVKRILANVEGVERLFLSLLYGTGLRLTEALRLRIKDVDLIYDQITIRDGKGGKDRVTMLPVSLKADLMEHLKGVKRLPRGRSARRLRPRLPSSCIGKEVPEGAGRMGLAVRLPGGSDLPRSSVGRAPPPSSTREAAPASFP